MILRREVQFGHTISENCAACLPGGTTEVASTYDTVSGLN